MIPTLTQPVKKEDIELSAKILEKVDSLLTEKTWIQHKMFADENDHDFTGMELNEELAKCIHGMCLVGAATLACYELSVPVDSPSRWHAFDSLRSKAGVMSLPAFNDSKSFPEVKSLLRNTIEGIRNEIQKV